MKKNTINTIIGILSLLLVVAIVGFVVKFTNGLNEDFKSFYIEHNGKQIVTTTSDITFDFDSEHRFDCKYLSEPENSSYNLKIVPNVTEDTDFEFVCDDKVYTWSSLKDITSAFTINIQNDYFVLSIPKDFSVFKVLSTLYPYSSISITESLPAYQRYFTLVVSNYNSSIVYNINFNVYSTQDYITEVNSLQSTVTELNAQIDNLNTDIDLYVSTIKTYESELERLKGIIAENENTISNLETAQENNLSQIDELRTLNVSLSSQVQDLTVQRDNLTARVEELTLTNETLNAEIIRLNGIIDSYVLYIEGLENDSTAYVTLEVDGKVYSVFSIAKGSILFDITIPDSEDYAFDGWLLNEESVDLISYVVTENVTFVAERTKLFDIKFLDYYGDVYESFKVKEGESFIVPDFPETFGARYDFFYDDLTNAITCMPKDTFENVTSDLTFIANAVNIATITFKIEDILTFGVRCSSPVSSDLETWGVDISSLGVTVPIYYGLDECPRSSASTEFFIFLFDTTKYPLLDEDKYDDLIDGRNVYITFSLLPTYSPVDR